MSTDGESQSTMSESGPPSSRLPNPWVATPVLVATAIGWFIGRSVARLSCTSGSCGSDELVWGLAGAVVGFVGVLIIAILVVRSIAEWAAMRQEGPSGPPQQPDGPSRD